MNQQDDPTLAPEWDATPDEHKDEFKSSFYAERMTYYRTQLLMLQHQNDVISFVNSQINKPCAK